MIKMATCSVAADRITHYAAFFLLCSGVLLRSKTVTSRYSDIGLIMYPKLLVRAVRRACLELLAEKLKDQGLQRVFAFLDRQWDLEAEESMLLWYRYTHPSESDKDLPGSRLTLQYIFLGDDFEREACIAYDYALQAHTTHASTSGYTEERTVHVCTREHLSA
jgi:hypothetical protein